MPQVNLQTRSANRVAVVFDGKQVGAMRSLDMNDDYGHEPQYGIGDAEPFEHVPTAARYSLSCSQVVLSRKSLRQLSLTQENASGVLKGLVFDIEVFDKDTGELLSKYIGCSYTGGSVQINANAVLIASANFVALTRSGTVI
jgi:hypothetical protein